MVDNMQNDSNVTVKTQGVAIPFDDSDDDDDDDADDENEDDDMKSGDKGNTNVVSDEFKYNAVSYKSHAVQWKLYPVKLPLKPDYSWYVLHVYLFCVIIVCFLMFLSLYLVKCTNI